MLAVNVLLILVEFNVKQILFYEQTTVSLEASLNLLLLFHFHSDALF